MTTLMNRHPDMVSAEKVSVQKICIGMGGIFILMGLLGIIFPNFLGMHLSLGHNLIHFLSGIISLWCGLAKDWGKSYNFCIGFGILYGILGLGGFILGGPGYPAIGDTEADSNLFRIIPNNLEFGTMDHLVHIILSFIFLVSAYFWRRSQNLGIRSIVDVQRHKDLELNRTKDAQLGESDINRASDVKRRKDFERRI
ncbi:MAG: hypothetical protein AB7I27_17030 [Bacteriovoracaceae bacterium]